MIPGQPARDVTRTVAARRPVVGDTGTGQSPVAGWFTAVSRTAVGIPGTLALEECGSSCLVDPGRIFAVTAMESDLHDESQTMKNRPRRKQTCFGCDLSPLGLVVKHTVVPLPPCIISSTS